MCIGILFSCKENKVTNEGNGLNSEINKGESIGLFMTTLEKHMNAITSKDLEVLKESMSPLGHMFFISPNANMVDSVNDYLKYNRDRFQDSTWTMEMEIMNLEVEDKMGFAIVKGHFRKNESNNLSNYNEQEFIISYTLRIEKGKWYVVKEQLTPIEKSKN